MHLSAKELKIVKEILRRHLPDAEVWAFGSRVHGQNLKKFSDLDLAVIAKTPLSSSKNGLLKEAFSASDLSFKVDIIDWAATDPDFQKLIKEHHQVIQPHQVGS